MKKLMKIMEKIINLIKEVFYKMSEIWNNVEVTSMSVIYAYLIIEGSWTFKRVPKYWKSDVAVVLVTLGAESLITDPTYLQAAKDRIEKANQN